MNTSERVMVYGASGHTGRFVVDELLRRGLAPVIAGRSATRLASGAVASRGLEQRVFGLDDHGAVQRALDGVGVVVNCAGPFLDTAMPLATAAVAAGAHYLDVTAEQAVAEEIYRELDEPARRAGVAAVPAMAFYGGLADLMVTAVVGEQASAERVDIAIALDHWWPTEGTRVTGRRNVVPRKVIRGGKLVELGSPPPRGTWAFPAPFGEQTVVELPFTEAITIGRHLDVDDLYSHLTTAPLDDLRDPSTPPPTAVDRDGRSDQRFVVDLAVRRASDTHRLTVTGQDIYAITAPIAVEGVVRLLDGRHRSVGANAPGAIFDATGVLAALERHPRGIRRDRSTEH